MKPIHAPALIEPLETRIAPAFGAVVELSALAGFDGFKLSGVAADDYSGISVSGAGDVNGDGFGDLIIGVYRADPNGTASGASYVVFGQASGFAPNLNLGTLDGSNGFKLSGVAADDLSGYSVSMAGDVNGDGFGDLIIGAYSADPNGDRSGASYVVFGKASGFAANLNLATLDGSNGFKLSGVAVDDRSGYSVSMAGDVNGDGFDDLIIGAHRADPNGNYSGASYVVFGKAGGFAANLNLGTLDGSSGFKLSGVAAYDYSGGSVSAAGDVNGDGFGDLIIGAQRADPNGTYSGASYVVFGKPDFSATAGNLNLATLDGSNGFKLSGVAGGDRSGASVSGAGDVNGDGFGDLIIGAFLADPNGPDSGASYVVFGQASGFAANLNLGTLDGSNGFKLSGVAADDRSGVSVSGAGDVNGDGFGDLIIGAFLADPNGPDSGASYVVFGKADFSATAGNLNLATLDGNNGFALSGAAAGDNSGLSVGGAGDVNGDGFDDVIIGARGADPNGDASGASYVVFGQADNSSPTISDITNRTIAPGTSAGPIAFTIGDVETAPGALLVTATSANPALVPNGNLILGGTDANRTLEFTPIAGQKGQAIISVTVSDGNTMTTDDFVVNVFSRGPVVELSGLAGFDGFRLSGETAGDYSGASVSGAGDVNGDGIDDVIIGATKAVTNGTSSGASYVVFGRASGFAADLNLGTLDGSNGFKLNGVAAGNYTGYSVGAAGDVNGDGFGDLIIGAYRADPNGSDSGASYVVFGKADFSATAGNVNISTLDGTNGFALNGVATEDSSGYSVSGAGDVNGDGFDDLIIGAYGVALNGFNSGASYVVFGKADFSATAGNVNFSTLDGTNGFALNGVAENDLSGGSVSGAGDVNGDGFDDLIIGALRADPNGDQSGASYVVFGKADFSATAGNLNLSTLDGTSGFKLSGVTEFDLSGRSVSGAGDVNGDGFDDVIIGARFAAPNGDPTGASYVVFGKADFSATAGNLNLSTLDGTNGFALSGVAADDSSGFSVSGAGDANGDGFDDLIIGAHYADPNGSASGASYVVFGKEGGFAATLNLSSLDGTNGFALNGVAANDRSGRSVSGAGDVNGDGFDDLIIGAFLADPNGSYSGASYVVFGGPVMGLGVPTLSISDVSLAEGPNGLTAFGFTVTLSEASSQTVTVLFSTADGTAMAGSDFIGLTDQFLQFNPGETSRFVLVNVNGDTEIEPDEVFTVVLSSPSNATIAGGGGGTATGTILNDDVAPPVFVSISDGAGLEGNSGTRQITFEVTLSAASADPVSVMVSTVDGTATSGTDFTAINGQLVSFAPGELSKLVTVDALGDTTLEATENFSLVLSQPVNATLAEGTGMGAIVNDDTATPPPPQQIDFMEADGDQIMIRVSNGTISLDDLEFVAVEGGALVSKIDLTGMAAQLDGGKLTIEVVSAGGNGIADIGLIDGTGVNLKKVEIQGDVTQLILGDPGAVGVKMNNGKVKPAVKSLNVGSLGMGAANFPSLTPTLSAPGIGKLNVQGSVANFAAEIGLGAAGGGINSVSIGANIEASTFVVGGIVGKVAVKNSMTDTTFEVRQSIKNLIVNRDIENSEVHVGTALKGLVVGGSLIDSKIIAPGGVNPNSAGKAKAFGIIGVKGDVIDSEILAGYDENGDPVNAAAGIGKIVINGRFEASSIVAGVIDATGDGFGRNDTLIPGGVSGVIAQIAKITIKGAATGSLDNPDDHFGITAGEIKNIKFNGSKVPVTGGLDNLALDPISGDFRLVEFS